MANLKEIRGRISSVSSTMKITNAMKMVSAAKLNRAQEAITAMRPYSNKLTELLQHLSASNEGGKSAFAEEREVKRLLIVAISSNRGLAGAFNSNIVKQVRNLMDNDYPGIEAEVLTLGKKANDVLKKDTRIFRNNNEIFDELKFADVAEIAEDIMDDFVEGKYDRVMFVYNKFVNAGTQVVMTEQFLPIVAKPEEAVSTSGVEVDYLYEPDRESIISELIPKSLKMQLFKALRDSVASEHGARMTAMHKATDNAEDLRSELTLSYNKARQAAITNEILEIVGGAEALNG